MSNFDVERLEKFKSIPTEVFALTLGLGAFFLSIIPKDSLKELSMRLLNHGLF